MRIVLLEVGYGRNKSWLKIKCAENQRGTFWIEYAPSNLEGFEGEEKDKFSKELSKLFHHDLYKNQFDIREIKKKFKDLIEIEL